jgi:hypothetical protein
MRYCAVLCVLAVALQECILAPQRNLTMAHFCEGKSSFDFFESALHPASWLKKVLDGSAAS